MKQSLLPVLKPDLQIAFYHNAHAKRESPTTTRFFNIDHIQDPNHEEYQLFRDLLSSLLSIQIQLKTII